MSLRVRLFVSHVLVTIVSLIALTLTIMLLLTEFQRGLMLRELSNVGNNLWRLTRNAPAQSPPDQPQGFFERATRTNRDNGLRVLLLDEQGAVVADSSRVTGSDHLGEKLDLQNRPSFITQNRDVVSVGEFRDRISPQRRWAYVVFSAGQVLNSANTPPSNNSQGWIAVARQLPQRIFLGQFFAFLDDDVYWPVFQALLATLTFAGIIAALVARSIAKPIQNVTAAANAIADGDYARRVNKSGPQEMKQLAGDFNRMVDRVQNSQRMERDLLMNVSHELKTPLTSIKGFAQAIMDGTASDPETAQHVAKVIYDESERLNRLVNSLLDSMRMETGNAPLEAQPTQINDIARLCLAKFDLRAKECGIALRQQLAQLPNISLDADRIAQVLTNLIDNAIKYTHEGGHVLIKTAFCPQNTSVFKGASDAVEISVIDNGDGIPPEDLPRIFDRFYQVDKARANGSGTGLGLSISKQIVEAHNGHIHAQSQVGQGTQMTIWLPIKA